MNKEQFCHNCLRGVEPDDLQIFWLLMVLLGFVIGVAYGCWGMSRRLRREEEIRRWTEQGDRMAAYRRSIPPHVRQFPAK